ncbi:MAG: helix-turn-helix domain-containing protein [Cellvibrionaceae bacterium]
MEYYSIGLHFKHSSPEIKCFLIKFLHTYGLGSSVEKTYKELIKELGVTDRVVHGAIQYLVENGYFEKEIKTSARQGGSSSRVRKTTRYLCSPKLVRLLDDFESGEYKCLPTIKTASGGGRTRVFTLRHTRLISHLLQADSARLVEKKRHPLNLSNRLLLMVMLSYANEYGVVSLGYSSLSVLTGMGRDRLDSQIEKLKREGYIRCHVPGGTHPYLFGATEGVYFLNLKHERFGGEGEAAPTIVLQADNTFQGRASIAIQIIREAASVEKNKRKEQGSESSVCVFPGLGFLSVAGFEQISVFFWGKNNLWFKDYLQMKLEAYASMLLSRHWKALSEGEEVEDGEVMAVIQAELLTKKAQSDKPEEQKGTDDLYFTQEQRDLLYRFIFDVSCWVALRFCRALKAVESLPFEELEYSVVPFNCKAPYRGFLIFDAFYKHGSDASNENGCIILKYAKGELINHETLKNEALLSDDERYRYGLLTMPKK